MSPARPPRSTGRPRLLDALPAAIDTIEAQTAELGRRIKEALASHPDAPVVTSLPRAGRIRAAALLAEIGDARGRDARPAAAWTAFPPPGPTPGRYGD